MSDVPKPRVTIFDHQMDLSAVKGEEKTPILASPNEMDMTNVVSKNPRMTIFANDTVSDVTCNIVKEAARRTVFNETDLELTQQESPCMYEKMAKKPRMTIYENEMVISEFYEEQKKADTLMDMSRSVTKSTGAIPKVFANRPTTFHQNEMEVESAEEVPARQTTFANESIREDHQVITTRVTIHQQSDMDFSGVARLPEDDLEQAKGHCDLSEVDLLRNVVFTPPSGFKNLEMIERKSVIVQNEAPSFHEPVKIQLTRPDVKEDSRKWHNVTDTDLNMLDDESNPCVSDSTDFYERAMKKRISEGNISRYEEALDDFVNLTIEASPLNATLNSLNVSQGPENATKSKRRVSRPLSPVRDYGNMLDDLLANLKKKNTPKPRLEIDDYLEKLNIAPVKLIIRPECEPEGILKRINAVKEKMRLRRERNSIEVPQLLPEIPPIAFLMRNYFDW